MFKKTSVVVAGALGAFSYAAADDGGGQSGPGIEAWDVINASDFLSQNWSKQNMDDWYMTSIGSRLIPLPWYMALRDENGDKLLSKANFDRLQYIYTDGLDAAPAFHETQLSDPGNTGLVDYSLPVGFIADAWKEAAKQGTYSNPDNFKTGTADKWLSINCSACHTAKMQFGSEMRLVHGAPAMSDFMGFVNGIDKAMQATLANAAQFETFAQEVLGPAYSSEKKAQLREELDAMRIWRERIYLKNGQHESYGYGRLDAVGHILNQVSLLVHDEADMPLSAFDPAVEANKARLQWSSSAPVDYPHLWNTSQQALLQWNGVAATNKIKVVKTSYDAGALGRNTGQVTGVFADIKINSNKPGKDNLKLKLTSSAQVVTLLNMEKTLSTLFSPDWPQDIAGFALDMPRINAGKALFEGHCRSCHTHLEHDDIKKQLPLRTHGEKVDKIVMNWITDVGTDIWMACNADQFGVTRDLRKTITQSGGAVMPNPDEGKILPGQDPRYFGASMLTDVIKSTIIPQAKDIILKVLSDLFFGGGSEENITDDKGLSGAQPLGDAVSVNKAETCISKSNSGLTGTFEKDYTDAKAAYDAMGWWEKFFNRKKKKQLETARDAAKKALKERSQLRYKSRPLNGIWAAAPYLHNGSVPTLYDLLLPPKNHDGSGVIGGATTANIPTYVSQKYRPDCFSVGSRDYDAKRGGFTYDKCDGSGNVPAGRSKFDTKVLGNSNAGHNYPVTGLTEEERLAIVEYLKSI